MHYFQSKYGAQILRKAIKAGKTARAGFLFPIATVATIGFGTLILSSKKSFSLGITLLAFVALSILALPSAAKQPGQPVPLPLPAKVEQNLPGDVPGQAVRLVKGCYVYVYEGEVFPVVDANDKPVCR